MLPLFKSDAKASQSKKRNSSKTEFLIHMGSQTGVWEPEVWGLTSGDSESGCWKNMCCGDDSNEHVKCNTDNPDVCACCNSNDEFVNKNGECVTCLGEGEACTTDDDCCETTTQAEHNLPMHCSDIGNEGEPIEHPHCCPNGQYWNGVECEDAEQCGIKDEVDYCPYLPPNDPS